jgi:hypothetical protein
MGQQLTQWVPYGTSLATAQQTMQSHGFACSTASFDGPEEMTNRHDTALDGPLWGLIVEKNGKRSSVTNIAYLDCQRTNRAAPCEVRFILLNGETARCRASGAL